MSNTRTLKSDYRSTVHIIGGGPMGLLAAIDTLDLAHKTGVDVNVAIYESEAFGGGRHGLTSSPRCQLWLHTHGQLFARYQPHVSYALSQSTQRLQSLYGYAFYNPQAFVIDTASDDEPELGEFFQAAAVPHQRIPAAVMQYWQDLVAPLQFKRGQLVYKVYDGVIDLSLLSAMLLHAIRRRRIRITRSQVRLKVRGDRVCALVLADGEQIPVSPNDQVVLACGARIRSLLGDVGITVPGLRLFQSHLVATGEFNLDALVVAHGVTNCVPHKRPDGRVVNLFGNGYRTELPPEADAEPLRHDPQAIESIRQDVCEWFGLEIPARVHSWSAVKTEIIPVGIRSQKHHANLIPGLTNAYLTIPGKLSQAAACSLDIARIIVKKQLELQLTAPVAVPAWTHFKRLS